MSSPNIKMLQTVASGMRELLEKVAFVGGTVVELYPTNPAASEVRATLDVDCVIEIYSRTAYAELENTLRSKGFSNDISEGAPICRWIYKNITVDVMPDDPDIIGFSNKWYSDGIQNKIKKELPNGQDIFIFRPEYFLCTKFEAHRSRGGNDLRQSRDFEDIVYLIENYPEITEDITRADKNVKAYLKQKCRILLENPNLSEGIDCALSSGSLESDQIIEIIKTIVKK